MGPINYQADVQSPFASAIQGYQIGAGIKQNQDQQALLGQQQQAQAQQQQMLLNLANNPNARAEDYAQVMTVLPQYADHLGKVWAFRSEPQQRELSANLLKLGAALKSGYPDLAAKMMSERADAMERVTGPTPDTQALRTLSQVATGHPELALGQIHAMLAVSPLGKTASDALKTFGEESRAEAEAPAKLRNANAEATIREAAAAVAPQAEQQKLAEGAAGVANTRSMIADRSARLGLDQDRLTSETQAKLMELTQKFGQLPDDARRLVNESAVNSTASEQAVQQYHGLAGQIDKLGGSWGSASSAHEWLKRAWGGEDAVSAIKREYTRMASQGVIKLLPPGPASDKDIANAKEGIPNANASPEVMASYLRGMAKLSAYDAVLNDAKSEWVGAVQHLGRTKADIEVSGTKVPAGTTFNEFARTYLATKAQELNASATVSNRGYMRHAQPERTGQTPNQGGVSGSW